MAHAHKQRSWFGLWRSAPARWQDDPADLGTAFGLDLSLPDPDAAAALPAPVTTGARLGWVRRLAARRRAADSGTG